MPPSKKSPKKKGKGKPASEPLRFAHPFFSPQPPTTRTPNPIFGQRMLDYIQTQLGPVPPTRGNGTFTLDSIIGSSGVQQIQATGKIILHIAGDTGVPELDRETNQTYVAEAMAKDFNIASPATSPAFFLHLGDVIYGAATDAYLSEFFRPYMHYPGKIIAIPGNHDGESAVKLKAFQDNFCALTQVVPPIAGSIFRQTQTEPGVYWCLDAPFVQIIGLYSNCAENPGAISGGAAGSGQKNWLVSTLKALKTQRDAGVRKALFIVTHHPPYSSGGHTGSTQMLADIDDACKQAGIMPNAFFSGHSHSIQRYTRTVTFGGKTLKIPYVVSGCGGHGAQAVASSPGHAGDNPYYEFGYNGWGYTLAEITSTGVTITSRGVAQQAVKQIDTVTFPL